MKKCFCILLCLLYCTTSLAMVEDPIEPETPTRVAPFEEIYSFVEKYLLEKVFVLSAYYDKSLNWYLKGKQAHLTEKHLEDSDKRNTSIKMFDFHIYDVVHDYPYYAIYVYVQGMTWFPSDIREEWRTGKLFLEGRKMKSPDIETLGWSLSFPRKLYVEDIDGKLVLLEAKSIEHGYQFLENFKINVDQFRGEYREFPKQGYENIDDYYFDQLKKSLLKQQIDTTIYIAETDW